MDLLAAKVNGLATDSLTLQAYGQTGHASILAGSRVLTEKDAMVLRCPLFMMS